MVNAAHPDSGVSWNWILTIAMRGDLKNRRQPSMRVGVDELKRPEAKSWRKYAAELDQIIAAGRTGELAHPGRFPTDAATLIPAYALLETS